MFKKASSAYHKSFFFFLKSRPNINLYIEYSQTLIWVFEDSKFTYKTTKFYAEWPVRNFEQKRDLQYLEKICYVKSGFKFFMR